MGIFGDAMVHKAAIWGPLARAQLCAAPVFRV